MSSLRVQGWKPCIGNSCMQMRSTLEPQRRSPPHSSGEFCARSMRCSARSMLRLSVRALSRVSMVSSRDWIAATLTKSCLSGTVSYLPRCAAFTSPSRGARAPVVVGCASACPARVAMLAAAAPVSAPVSKERRSIWRVRLVMMALPQGGVIDGPWSDNLEDKTKCNALTPAGRSPRRVFRSRTHRSVHIQENNRRHRPWRRPVPWGDPPGQGLKTPPSILAAEPPPFLPR